LYPSLSIITTAYNHQRFIGACIRSVLGQTYGDWEQIVLDDGSTDGTGDEVRQFSDARVRYVWQQHRGIEALAHSYNHALSFCRAPIIAILEGDDLWSPGKLEQQMPALDDDRIVLAYGEVLDIDAEGNIAKSNSRTAERRKKMPAQILDNHPVGSATAHLLTLQGQAFIQPATVLLRRSALDRIGGFQFVPGICPPDVPTFIQLSLLGEFAYTPQVLGYRRRHVSSSTLQFLEPMSNSPRDFVLEMLGRADLGLSAAQREAIARTWRPRSQTREFVAGRLCLLQRQWKQARSHFVQALGPADPRAAAVSAVGWLLSWAHRDLEGVFRMAGRTPLRPLQRQNDSGFGTPTP
jgi:hypothetical protein